MTRVVGAAFGREPSVAALFAGKARSYDCHASMDFLPINSMG